MFFHQSSKPACLTGKVEVVLADFLSFFDWLGGDNLQFSVVVGGREDSLTVGVLRVICKLGPISVIDEQVAGWQVDTTVEDEVYLLVR